MQYKKTKLKNGLRIVTAPMENTETATVVVMVGVGSRYESEKEAGLSHFIEHMFSKAPKSVRQLLIFPRNWMRSAGNSTPLPEKI